MSTLVPSLSNIVRSILSSLCCLMGYGCAHGAPPPPAKWTEDPSTTIQLIPSWPVETNLKSSAEPEAHVIWNKLFTEAKSHIDIGQFYISPKEDKKGRLSPLLEAIADAGKRGVHVRILVDAYFAEKYPKPLKHLESLHNVEVRRWNMKKVTGGVLHAKYFIIDRQ